MNFYELVEKRRSVRRYKTDPVPREILERLGRAVELAPSACNKQPCKIKIVTNKAMLDAIRAACPQLVLKDVTAIAAVIGNPADAWRRPEGESIIPVDAAIAMEHLILAATEEGLGTCWVCAYNMSKVNAALGVESPANVYALTPLGYASESPPQLIRKDKAQVFEITD